MPPKKKPARKKAPTRRRKGVKGKVQNLREKNPLKRKLGPLPVWAWAIVAFAAVWWYRNRQGGGGTKQWMGGVLYGRMGPPGPRGPAGKVPHHKHRKPPIKIIKWPPGHPKDKHKHRYWIIWRSGQVSGPFRRHKAAERRLRLGEKSGRHGHIVDQMEKPQTGHKEHKHHPPHRHHHHKHHHHHHGHKHPAGHRQKKHHPPHHRKKHHKPHRHRHHAPKAGHFSMPGLPTGFGTHRAGRGEAHHAEAVPHHTSPTHPGIVAPPMHGPGMRPPRHLPEHAPPAIPNQPHKHNSHPLHGIALRQRMIAGSGGEAHEPVRKKHTPFIHRKLGGKQRGR